MGTKGKLAAALLAIAFLLVNPVAACASLPSTSASGHPCCPEKSSAPDDCTGQSCCAAAPAAPSVVVVNVDEWSIPLGALHALVTTPVPHEMQSVSMAVSPPAALERYLAFHQILV